MEDKKFAVLIDSDNISAKYLEYVLSEMTKYGTVTYRRIYGDWTTPQASKWRQVLMENDVRPIQQFRNTIGKNATDATMIIDAMDILYTGQVDGFCLVSSDGDFTRLASRLRESGMDVIGMGEKKTPRSFRSACTVFTDLELLIESEREENVSTEATAASKKSSTKKKKKESNAFELKMSEIENAILEIINENNDKGRDTGLGELGNRLLKKYTDFDVRRYGYSSLSMFVQEMHGFQLITKNQTKIVEIKKDVNMKQQVVDFIVDNVKKAGAKGIDIGPLGQRIHSQYPSFKVKEYGYSTYSKFINSLNMFNIESYENGKKIVTMRI